MDRNIRAKDLRRILVSFGLEVRDGKGSELVIKGPKKLQVIGHHGKNPEIQQQVVRALRRKFGLSANDGVSDDAFYGR